LSQHELDKICLASATCNPPQLAMSKVARMSIDRWAFFGLLQALRQLGKVSRGRGEVDAKYIQLAVSAVTWRCTSADSRSISFAIDASFPLRLYRMRLRREGAHSRLARRR
jgi:hypothetical protein